MRRWALIVGLPALAGCFLFPGSDTPSGIEDVPPHLRASILHIEPVPDRFPYGDVTRLRVGPWATYREPARTLTLRVVAQGPEGMWVEVVDEGDPRRVSAQLVTPDGSVKKAFCGEVSKDGKPLSRVEPQPLSQGSGPAASRRTEIGRETGEEKVTVGSRELAARRVRVRYEDLEGRLLEEVTLWHPDVPPIYASSDAGGLVRRTSGDVRVELLDFGDNAKPLLSIPRE